MRSSGRRSCWRAGDAFTGSAPRPGEPAAVDIKELHAMIKQEHTLSLMQRRHLYLLLRLASPIVGAERDRGGGGLGGDSVGA